MPKSNFNQFLDECEDFGTAEKMSISKISFETKPPSYNDEIENQTKQTGGDGCKTLNVFSSISNSNVRSSSSSSSSSNVFLSKSANNGRDRFDRFSTNIMTNIMTNRMTNRMNNYTNANTATATATTANTASATAITAPTATNVQTNIFKKTGDNNHFFNPNPTQLITSQLITSQLITSQLITSTQVVEINDETFPSLTSTTVAAAKSSSSSSSSSVPKKFKNFKDAICAAAPPSPTKQKQAQVLSTSAIPLPMVVKRDSEVYAKKMLAKTKNISAFYDDGDDDDGDYDNRDSKPMFSYENDSD
jgi:hypothetical protein